MRAASIRLMDDIGAAFIRGRRIYEGGVYIRKYCIMELVESISRDERDAPYTNTLQTLEYLTLATLSHILNTTIVFYG